MYRFAGSALSLLALHAKAYINRHGGIRSAALSKLVENLWCWALEHLFSLRALHIPGLENKGDLMSTGFGHGFEKRR